MKNFRRKKTSARALVLVFAAAFALAASKAQAACPYACTDLATATGNIDTTGNTLTNNIDAGSTYGAIISGTGNGGVSLIVTDTGATANVWQLSHANSFSGSMEIQNGASVQLTANNAVGDSSSITVDTGGALDIGATSQLLKSLGGGGNITTATNGVITENGTATYSGVISGGGSIATTGTGNWTLSGTNTYTGTTTVGSGTTLILSGAGSDIASSSSTTVNAGGTLDINTEQTVNDLKGAGHVTLNNNLTDHLAGNDTFSGVIGGAGGNLFLSGAGMLTLSGANTFAGVTEIGNGTTLELDGTLLGVSVDTGGQLQGIGTITVDVGNNGTVMPGNANNPTGALTTSGYVQATFSQLSIQFNPATSSELIAGSDGVDLAWAINYIPLVSSSKYVRGKTYTIIDDSTGPGVGGAFTKAADGSAMPADNIVTGANDPAIAASSNPELAIETIYNANSVQARIVRAELFSDSGVTTNERVVGSALDTQQLTAVAGSNMDTLLNNLSSDSTATQATDLNHLAGEINADVQTGFRDSMRIFDGMLGKRLGGDCTSMGDSPAPHYGLIPSRGDASPQMLGRSAWACGYGNFGTVDGDGNASQTKSTIAGGAFGMEFQPSSRTLLRFGLGYSNDAIGVSALDDNASLNSYQAGIYGQITGKHAYIGGSLAGAYENGETKRHILVGLIDQIAKGNPDGYSMAASGTFGLFTQIRRLMIDVAASAEYIYTKQNAFDESGAGGADLSVSSKSINSLRGTLGAQASTTFYVGRRGMTLTPEARVALIEDALDVRPSATETFTGTAASFTTNGANPGRMGVQGGGGFTLDVSRRLSLFADYNGTFKNHEHNHAVLGGLKYSW